MSKRLNDPRFRYKAKRIRLDLLNKPNNDLPESKTGEQGLKTEKLLFTSSLVVVKKIALIILIIWFFGTIGYNISRISKEREKNAHINKAIYPAFRTIENYCEAYIYQDYVSQEELKKCKAVVSESKSCDNPNVSCTAEKYYKFLSKRGFELPPFYDPEYSP